MNKIKIEKNTNGDSRVATSKPDFIQFEKANCMHCNDVDNMMSYVADRITSRGRRHDYTKKIEPHRSAFYRDLCNTIDGAMQFDDGEWSKTHYETERHHLNRHCPDDVNLIDVIEMICDCICAGMARRGEYSPISISDEILQKAVRNTEKMCVNAVEVIE